MTIAKQSLLEAAKAVLGASARNHLRKHHLDALRQAVAEAEREKGLSEWVKFERSSKAVTDHIEDSLGMVYMPMTDDTFHKIASENIDEMNASGWLNLYEVYGKAVERAVAERLGLRWPE